LKNISENLCVESIPAGFSSTAGKVVDFLQNGGGGANIGLIF